MASYVLSSNVHGKQNRFLEYGCNIIFDNHILYSKALTIRRFLPLLLPDIVKVARVPGQRGRNKGTQRKRRTKKKNKHRNCFF